MNSCGQADNRFFGLQRFTGKERDSESGLDYFGARYYGSALGRFASPDPLPWLKWQRGKEDDQKLLSQFLSNPQNLDMYGYVEDNPLTHDDPSGMSDLIYNGQAHTLTLVSSDGRVIGTWHASNNVDSHATLGRLPDGTYPVLDQHSAHSHGNAVDRHDPERQDSANGEFGSGGIFRIQDFTGPDGRLHQGVGVHAGRESRPDAAGRVGADHATEGCIRTCDAAVHAIAQTAQSDPLHTVRVESNRSVPPPPQTAAPRNNNP